MPVASILVHVEPGPASEARLAYALSLAKRFDAAVTGIAVTVPPTEVAFAMMGDAQLYNVAIEAAGEATAAAKAQFEKVTAGCDAATRWCEPGGIPEEVVAAYAGCHDLVVIGGEHKTALDGGFYTLQPANVVLTCGRPVLVLPDDSPDSFSGDRILAAWRSTQEAGRAIHDAMPLLQCAKDVILAEVTEGAGHTSPTIVTIDDMAEHLRAHGVPVTIRRLITQAGAAGECLIEEATESGAELIVAGCYGHSRLREWVLGGVSRTLLQTSPTPCLLSH